jgi:carbamoyl-phosphate synthase large subunit
MTASSTTSRAPFHVLIFPGGTEIGLEIRQALAPCKEVKLFSAGLDVSNHAPFAFAHHALLPSVRDAGWIERLNAVVDEYQIDYIFPAYDDVLLALAENADRIRAAVITSPVKTCRVTRSKRATYRLLADVVPVPKTYEHPDRVDAFPVFVKPDRGQGSQETFLAHDREQLAAWWRRAAGPLIMEYLPGQEFTVDCFSDREHGLLFCTGRERTRVRQGISMHGRLVNDPRFAEYAAAIAGRLTLHGAWFFQLKCDRDDRPTLLEVAPRIAGTMALNRVRGVNFPLLSIYEHQRVPLEIVVSGDDVEIDRALINRYRRPIEYRTLYLDLDDTLVVHGRLNLDLVRLAHQCVARGVRVVLLTRHREDLPATLGRHRIRDLFDEVVHLGEYESKAAAINDRQAIFIDDSFRERRLVREALGIPTFDGSMAESLFDDRI